MVFSNASLISLTICFAFSYAYDYFKQNKIENTQGKLDEIKKEKQKEIDKKQKEIDSKKEELFKNRATDIKQGSSSYFIAQKANDTRFKAKDNVK